MKPHRIPYWLIALVALSFVAVTPSRVLAHCDGMDGPVVKATRQALDAGDVNLVLVWVQTADEAELRKAFVKTIAVRKLNPEAKALADQYLFETVVRLHRAGEGAPYTGLKPAGRDLGPAIPAADKALEDGSATALVKMLTEASAARVQGRFEKALATSKYEKSDVELGRRHVKAYVEFVHYVEALYAATLGSDAEHAHGSGDVIEPHSHYEGGKRE